MPKENMRLKASGRSGSRVRLATAGERQTAQKHRVIPVRVASPNCAGWERKQMRSTEKTTVHSRPPTSVRRMPKRSAQMPAGMVPNMLPNGRETANQAERSFIKAKTEQIEVKEKKVDREPKAEEQRRSEEEPELPPGRLGGQSA